MDAFLLGRTTIQMERLTAPLKIATVTLETWEMSAQMPVEL